MNEVGNVPPLLVIFCAMSAMTFVISTIGWVFSAGFAESEGRSLRRAIWKAQLLNFVAILLFSIFVIAFDSLYYGGKLSIIGEVSILGIIVLVFLAKCVKKKKNFIVELWKSFKSMATIVLMSLGGWGFSIVFYWSIGIILFAGLGTHRMDDLLIVPPFITGLVWNVPIIWAYLYYKGKKEPARELAEVKLHNLLWPVLLAYVVMIVPLFIQQVTHTETWKEWQNAKPPISKI